MVFTKYKKKRVPVIEHPPCNSDRMNYLTWIFSVTMPCSVMILT
jgi:hypothetical protein